MVEILTLSMQGDPLPALALLPHRVHRQPPRPDRLAKAHTVDVVLVDAVDDLAGAQRTCALLAAAGCVRPVLLVVTEGGMAAVGPRWPIADVVLHTAGPAELDARLRLACSRTHRSVSAAAASEASGITIDEQAYSASLRGKVLDLTFREFQLLRFLAAHPARVFTREELLDQVWGDDYFGGTRTVDVHVRRLRAKLGEAEQLIDTVRNVGYRFGSAAGSGRDHH